MTLPHPTDYDRPHCEVKQCRYCGEDDDQGATIKGEWVCTRCLEEIEYIRHKDDEEDQTSDSLNRV